MNVPLIRTQDAFRKFIRDTPISTRGIALVHDHFMSGGNTFDPIYAVAYEKEHDCDKLYLYDTDVVAGMSRNYFKPFFRENFCLFYPDKKHRVYNQFPNHDIEAIENASVLEDISILYEQRDKVISIPNFMSFFSPHTPPTVTKNTNLAMASFNLSPVFDYNESEVRREHLCELIKHNEAGLLLDDQASSSPPR